MSRATITGIDAASVGDRETLRQRHGVRLVQANEEGASIHDVPDGVYGFTHSPAVAAPLFSQFRYRAFEMHRTGGEAFIVGFMSKADADRLRDTADEADVTLFHDRVGDADVLVAVPYTRIVRHRQYSGHNTPGLPLRISQARR